MNNRKKQSAIALFIALFLLISPLPSSAEDRPLKQLPAVSYLDLQPIGRALSLLRLVDLRNRDSKTFLYAALAGMIEGFDRYSHFVDPDMVSFFLDKEKEEYVGIGVHIVRTEDRDAEVLSVEDDSPAARAGIEPKDVIIALDGRHLPTMRSIDIARLLRGPDKRRGSGLTIRLRKQGGGEEQELALERERIKIRPVESRSLQNGVGYVRIHEFRSNTPEELKKALTELRQDGGIDKGILLDLRNNPGGEMIASVGVAALFISKGVIASLESNYPGLNTTFRADETAEFREPLVVLINRGSASGAELVAGVIKFYDRGTVLGNRSFGKGTFQSFVPITNELGAYLTLGRFTLPDGNSPEGQGITPDIVVDASQEGDRQLTEALKLFLKTAGSE